MAHVNSTINKRYIIRAKLNDLLKRLFGDDYTLKERGDVFGLAAARKLTDVSDAWPLLRADYRETHNATVQEEIASVSRTE